MKGVHQINQTLPRFFRFYFVAFPMVQAFWRTIFTIESIHFNRTFRA